jgi:hypothetical protein
MDYSTASHSELVEELIKRDTGAEHTFTEQVVHENKIADALRPVHPLPSPTPVVLAQAPVGFPGPFPTTGPVPVPAPRFPGPGVSPVSGTPASMPVVPTIQKPATPVVPNSEVPVVNNTDGTPTVTIPTIQKPLVK